MHTQFGLLAFLTSLGLPFEFVYPWLWLLGLLLIPLLWMRRKRQPAIGHSGPDIHKNIRTIPLVGFIPIIFYSLAFLAMVGALAKPVIPEAVETRSMRTRDIFIAVDISGSMGSSIGPRPDRYVQMEQDARDKGIIPKKEEATALAANNAPGGATAPAQAAQNYRALDAAQDAAYEFVSQRDGDRVALAIFDDYTYYHWPLTEDLKVIKRKACLVNRHTGGGTNFDGPSESSQGLGPIQASIDHFREYGKAKTKVLIMVSDGESTISPKRMKELLDQMKTLNAKAYLLGIGSSWVNAANNPNGSTKDLQNFITQLNGRVFAVANVNQMQQSFEAINQLEKSEILIETTLEYHPIYPIFVGVALLFVVLFLLTVSITRQVA